MMLPCGVAFQFSLFSPILRPSHHRQVHKTLLLHLTTMIAITLLLGLSTLAAVFFFGAWRGLRYNIAAAKQSGLPYVVVP